MSTEQSVCYGCFLNHNFIKDWNFSERTSGFAGKEFGLTWQEKDVLKFLGDAWNHFCSLENSSEKDSAEFLDAIHRAQQLIALRVARRVDKDVWVQP